MVIMVLCRTNGCVRHARPQTAPTYVTVKSAGSFGPTGFLIQQVQTELQHQDSAGTMLPVFILAHVTWLSIEKLKYFEQSLLSGSCYLVVHRKIEKVF